MGFVPNAFGEPRGRICWWDNRCSEKAIKHWQMAPTMIEEGGEARTVNLCKLWYNAKSVQQGEQSLKLWEWKGVMEKKAHRRRRRIVEGYGRVLGVNNFCAVCGSISLLKRQEQEQF